MFVIDHKILDVANLTVFGLDVMAAHSVSAAQVGSHVFSPCVDFFHLSRYRTM